VTAGEGEVGAYEAAQRRVEVAHRVVLEALASIGTAEDTLGDLRGVIEPMAGSGAGERAGIRLDDVSRVLLDGRKAMAPALTDAHEELYEEGRRALSWARGPKAAADGLDAAAATLGDVYREYLEDIRKVVPDCLGATARDFDELLERAAEVGWGMLVSALLPATIVVFDGIEAVGRTLSLALGSGGAVPELDPDGSMTRGVVHALDGPARAAADRAAAYRASGADNHDLAAALARPGDREDEDDARPDGPDDGADGDPTRGRLAAQVLQCDADMGLRIVHRVARVAVPDETRRSLRSVSMAARALQRAYATDPGADDGTSAKLDLATVLDRARKLVDREEDDPTGEAVDALDELIEGMTVAAEEIEAADLSELLWDDLDAANITNLDAAATTREACPLFVGDDAGYPVARIGWMDHSPAAVALAREAAGTIEVWRDDPDQPGGIDVKEFNGDQDQLVSALARLPDYQAFSVSFDGEAYSREELDPDGTSWVDDAGTGNDGVG